jgi:transposase
MENNRSISVSSAQLTVSADAAGYRRVLKFARAAAVGRRLWAIEGTGSYGAGLTAFLLEQGEAVAEIDRPARRSAQRRQVR